MYLYDSTSLNSSKNKKRFRQNCRENQTHIVCSKTFFRKLTKYGAAGQLTYDNIHMYIRRIIFAFRIPKSTYQQSEYIIRVLIAFHGNYRYANAHKCYVIRHCLSCYL
jgi:hypothetical protein